LELSGPAARIRRVEPRSQSRCEALDRHSTQHRPESPCSQFSAVDNFAGPRKPPTDRESVVRAGISPHPLRAIGDSAPPDAAGAGIRAECRRGWRRTADAGHAAARIGPNEIGARIRCRKPVRPNADRRPSLQSPP